jgi:hypothetical protein
MSFLDSITNAVKGAASTVEKSVVYALDVNKAAFTNPITLITKGANAAIAESNKLTNPEVIQRTYATVAVAATGVLAAGTVAGRAITGTVAKALVPKTVTQAAITGGVAFASAPIIAGAIAANPTATENFVYNAPGNIYDFEKDLFQLSNKPTVEGAIQFLKDHPYLSSASAGAALIAAGFGSLGVANIVSNYFNTSAIKKNTEATGNINKDNTPEIAKSDAKDQIKIIEAQAKANENLIKQQTESQLDLIKAQNAANVSNISPTPAVVAPTKAAPAGTKPKKKAKKKTKKKTRRSKKKKKSIKRKVSKKR